MAPYIMLSRCFGGINYGHPYVDTPTHTEYTINWTNQMIVNRISGAIQYLYTAERGPIVVV